MLSALDNCFLAMLDNALIPVNTKNGSEILIVDIALKGTVYDNRTETMVLPQYCLE
jgi:hypothetical protein